MYITEIINSSLRAMRINKTRSLLTVLGVVVGITSIMIVYSAGEGVRGLLIDQIESFGTDVIEVEIKIPSNKGKSSKTANAIALAQGVQITTLKLDDMKEIVKLPNIGNAYSAIMGQELVSYENDSRKVFLLGTNASYIDIDKSEIEDGEFFFDTDDNSLTQVAVLGAGIKGDLFGDRNAVGEYVSIHKKKFRVIGVMKERGSVMSMDFDNYVYIPIRTMQKKMMGIDHVLYSVYKVNDMDYAEETAEEIRSILRNRHGISSIFDEYGSPETGRDDFRVVTMNEMMDMMNTITNTLTILLAGIMFISLIVGGVGILNIMYVIVSERSSEIGLRKAVGAKYKDIMLQFLTESVLITFFGALFGIFLGVLFSYLISLGANYAGLDWKFSVPLKAFVTSILFSLVFGVFFGVYPARKAARMDPVEAIRKE